MKLPAWAGLGVGSASLVVIPAFALVLRVRGLARETLWADELHVANAARRGLIGAVQEAAGDVYPPLHYAVAALTGGGSPEGLRVPSVLAGVATVALVAAVGRRAGHFPMWIAAGWLALLPAHVHYSQEARSYALLGLFFAGLLAAQEVWKKPIVAAWCASLCLYTHGLAPLLLLGAVVAALWRRDRTALLALAVGGATFLPWIGVSIVQRSRFSGWGGYDVPPARLLSDVVGFFGAGGLEGWLPLATGGAVLVVGLLSAARRESRPLVLAVLVPLLALYASGVAMHTVTAKHFSPLLPAFALVLVHSAAMVSHPAARLALLVVAHGSPWLGLRRSAQALPVRFDIAGVVRSTQQVRPAGSPIFAAFPTMWRYYLPDDPVGALPPPMEVAEAREILAWQQETWRGRSLTVWWWMQAGQDRAWSQMGDDWPFVWVTERAGAEGMAFTTDPGQTVPLAAAEREHVEIEHRDRTLGFYANGRASLRIMRDEVEEEPDGLVAIWLVGAPGGPAGDVRQPHVEITIGEGGPVRIVAPAQLTRVVLGAVHPGERLTVAFADDFSGPSGDRNVWVTRVEVFGADRVDIAALATSAR